MPILPSVIEGTDAPATTSTTYIIPINQTAQGTISSNGDHDWYKVTLTAGVTYQIALVGTGVNNLHNPILALMNSSGTQIASDDDSGPGLSSWITYTPSVSGTYYIDAGSSGNTGTGQYGIAVSTGSKPSFDVPMGGGSLDTDLSWSAAGQPAVVTYGFRYSPANYTVSGSNISTFSQCTATEMAAVNQILLEWSAVCGITFQLVADQPGGYTNNATILIGNYSDGSDGAGAFAFYPGSTAASNAAGDLWLNLSGGVNPNSIPVGSWTWMAIMHELGHAIGLSHPGDYNAAPGVSITYANNAQFAQDSNQYTVMSYFDASATGQSWSAYAQTPMMFDIYEAQMIYGANSSTRSGDTVYGSNSNAGSPYSFASNSTPIFAIWDAGGNDTLDCSGYSGSQVINLNQGMFSNVWGQTGNISIAIGTVIENATGGSGNDTITGNSANNTFRGGGGSDTIDGGGGFDRTIFNAASTSASIVHNANGSWTISASGQTETLTGVEVAQFTDRMVALRERTRSDLNADGTSEILFRNLATGAVSQLTNASGQWTLSSAGYISSDWTLYGAGDFNGDGTSDLLWRNSGGTVGMFTMNNGKPTWAPLTWATTDWQIVGVGDFNGDGTSDILWRNASTGNVGEYLMKNGQYTWGDGGWASSDWSVAGTGDFNGDGTSDILWWNSTNGSVGMFSMNSNGQPTWAPIGGASLDWSIIGTGDIDGNGTSDILWRNSTGSFGAFMMSNGQATWANVTWLDPAWVVAGVGDYNNDGTADIALRNATTGDVGALMMNNGQATWQALASVSTTLVTART